MKSLMLSGRDRQTLKNIFAKFSLIPLAALEFDTLLNEITQDNQRLVIEWTKNQRAKKFNL
jgi:hypothetical protein